MIDEEILQIIEEVYKMGARKQILFPELIARNLIKLIKEKEKSNEK